MSTPQPHPAPQDPPQGSGHRRPELHGPELHGPDRYGPGHRAPGFAPPVPPHVAAAHPAHPRQAAPTPGLPPIRPHRNWYWVTALFLPVGVLVTTLAVQVGGAPFSSPWLLAPFISLLPTVAWPIVVYLMRDGSERRRRSLLPPPPALMHIAPHPGAPAYRVWFQPRTSPPLDPRNLRPRRFWYAVAVVSPVLVPVISPVAVNVAGDWLGILLGLLLGLIIPPALVTVVLVRRARHRARIAREHLLREWEQAHRG